MSELDALLQTDEDAARDAALALGDDAIAKLRRSQKQGTHRHALMAPGWRALRGNLPERQRALLRIARYRGDHESVQTLLRPITELHLTGMKRDARWGAKMPFALDGLSALRGLERLVIQGTHVDGEVVFPSLQHLELRVLRGSLHVREAPELRTLVAERTQVDIDAASLPRVRSIEGHGVRFARRCALPKLETATLAVASVFDASLAPACESLTCHAAVEGLRGHASLQHLRVSAAVDLATLSLPALETLTLQRCDSFDGLPPGGLPKLRELHLRYAQVRSVEGLAAACPALQKLVLRGCSQLEDLAPLSGHPALRVLHLEQSGVRSLVGVTLPALEELHLTASRWSKGRIPEAMHPMVRPPSLVAKRKARRKSTATRPKVRRGKKGTHVARVRKFLLTRDLDEIDRGVELVQALGDVETSNALLEGTTLAAAPSHLHVWGALRESAFPFDRFVPNSVFEYRSGVIAPYREHAMRALVATAPVGSVGAELRARVRALSLDGQAQHRVHVPVDLARLSRFPALETLSVTAHGGLRNLDALVSLTSMRTLVLSTRKVEGGLRLPPGLRVLGVHTYDDWDPITEGEGFDRLEVLDLRPRVSPAALAPLTQLRSLRWNTSGGDQLAALAPFEKLERLSLLFAEDLRPLPALPALRHLEMPGRLSVLAVPPLPHLTRLDIGGRTGGLEPEELRKRFPALQEIGVFSYGEVFAARPLLDAGYRILAERYTVTRVSDRSVVEGRLTVI